MDFGALTSTTLNVSLRGSLGVDSGGSLETFEVSGFHDLRSAIGLENDDIVGGKNLGSDCGLGNRDKADEGEKRGGDHSGEAE